MEKQIGKISIILPTYNERENLSLLVKRLGKNLVGKDYELIVVDDNSPDGTGELAEKLSCKYPINVIHRSKKGILSTAIIEGINHADGAFVGKMDADLQHPFGKVPAMLAQIEKGAQIIIGSRYIKGGGTEGWPLWRRTMSKGATCLLHIFFPRLRKIKDPLSGFFFFKKDVVRGVNFHSLSHHILLEILIKGNYKRVVEVPYVFKKRTQGKSKLNFKEIVNYLRLLWRLKKEQK